MSTKNDGLASAIFIDGGERDPIRLAARDGRRTLPKRFYSKAEAAPVAEGFAVLLDGKPVRTPARSALVLPTLALAQACLQRRDVVPVPRSAAIYPIWALRLTDDCGMESGPMNEFGEPNMGNPSVRFDEGRERDGHWSLPFGLSIQPFLPNLRPRPAVPGSPADEAALLICPAGSESAQPFGLIAHRSPAKVATACQVQPFPGCESFRCVHRLMTPSTMASADSCAPTTTLSYRRARRLRRAGKHRSP